MGLIKTLNPVYININSKVMTRFINVSLLFIILGILNSAQGQTAKLFQQCEIDSINSYYIPLFSTDSVDFNNLSKSHFFNVYYYNGDCSVCFIKMRKAEAFFQENTNSLIETIFIVDTSDTIVFNYHRERLNLPIKILWDQNHRLYNQNINTCFLIDNSGNIVIEGDFIEDEKIQKKYFDIVKQLGSNN